MIALITAALEGLASLKFFTELFQKQNLLGRLEALEKKQQLMNQGVTKIALAKTPEEYKDALKDFASSWNNS